MMQGLKKRKLAALAGVAEERRNEIFTALMELQDKYLEEDPDTTTARQDAYQEIAERFSVKEQEVREIAIAGAKEALRGKERFIEDFFGSMGFKRVK